MPPVALVQELSELDLSGFQVSVRAERLDSLSTMPGITIVDRTASGTRSCSCTGDPCLCVGEGNPCHTTCHVHED